MSTNKTAKVSTKSGKEGLIAPRANGKRAVPAVHIDVSQAKVAKTAQDKQTKVIDELARLAIELHRDALKELERY